jgi:hypothetical protein
MNSMEEAKEWADYYARSSDGRNMLQDGQQMTLQGQKDQVFNWSWNMGGFFGDGRSLLAKLGSQFGADHGLMGAKPDLSGMLGGAGGGLNGTAQSLAEHAARIGGGSANDNGLSSPSSTSSLDSMMSSLSSAPAPDPYRDANPDYFYNNTSGQISSAGSLADLPKNIAAELLAAMQQAGITGDKIGEGIVRAGDRGGGVAPSSTGGGFLEVPTWSPPMSAGGYYNPKGPGIYNRTAA